MPLVTNTVQLKFEAEAAAAQAKVKELEDQLSELEKKVSDMGSTQGQEAQSTDNSAMKWTELSSELALAEKVYSAVKEQIDEMIKAAEQEAEVQAKVETIIHNQGGAVGATAAQFDAWASAMSRASGVEKDTILNAEAMAVSLGDLHGKQIPETTQAALDMAAVMGGDVQSSLTQIAGILETGVVPRTLKFSQALKEQIKDAIDSGDKDKALSLILSELQDRFGGAAAAMDKAGTGSDDVKNSITELRAEIGGRLLPGLHDLNEAIATNIDKVTDDAKKVDQLAAAHAALGYAENTSAAGGKTGTFVVEQHKDAIDKLTAAYFKDKSASEDLANSTDRLAQSQASAVDSTRTLADSYKDYVSLIGSMQSAEDNYQKNAKKLIDDRTKLEQQRSQLVAQGYSVESQKIKDLDQKLAENSKASAENAAQHDLDTKKIILGYMEQQLAAGGLTTAEVSFLLRKGKEWGIYSDKVVQDAADAEAEVQKYIETLHKIPGHINTVLEIIEQGSGGSGESAGGGIIGSGKKHAAGGSFIVPDTYGYEGFKMGKGGDTASGGELVTITPPGGGGGGGDIINNYFSFPNYVGSHQELASAMEQHVRKMQSEGKLPSHG